jgi:CYTH domain-containing protein
VSTTVRGIAPAWRRKDAPPSATWSLSGLASSLRLVAHSMKYAVVARERRYRVAAVPEGVVGTKEISDRYIEGTRLRLREVRELDGEVIRKLGYKVRLSKGPAEVACTNVYLNDEEWSVLATLPARLLRKKRHVVQRDGWAVAIDEHQDGTFIAEIDDRDQPSTAVPDWLDILEDVSDDERWTGISLAR